MGKTIKIFGMLAAFATATTFTSCDDGCTEPVVSFAITDLVPSDESIADAVSSIKVSALGLDTLMLTANTLTAMPLLLNPDTTFTSLKFEMNQGDTTLIDTVTFYYEPAPYFLSVDCGCSFFFTLDSITHTQQVIQSYEIINPSITNEKTPNITLYY